MTPLFLSRVLSISRAVHPIPFHRHQINILGLLNDTSTLFSPRVGREVIRVGRPRWPSWGTRRAADVLRVRVEFTKHLLQLWGGGQLLDDLVIFWGHVAINVGQLPWVYFWQAALVHGGVARTQCRSRLMSVFMSVSVLLKMRRDFRVRQVCGLAYSCVAYSHQMLVLNKKPTKKNIVYG